jgi:hypothetical protein
MLLAVQVIALGLIGFTAADWTSAHQARSEWVALELGAPTVVDAGRVVPARLLDAVRTADPSGRYAMAVVSLPPREAADPPTLAVDAPRLPAIASWPARTGVTATAVAAELHPAMPEPGTFTGRSVGLDVDTRDYATYFGDARTNPTGGRVGLYATFAPAGSDAGGDDQVTVDLGDLRIGRQTYAGTVPICLAGCRLVSVTVKPRSGTGLRVDLTIAGFTDASRWRLDGTAADTIAPTMSAGPGGLSVRLTPVSDVPTGLVLSPIDAPPVLPAVAAGSTVSSVPGDEGSGSLAVRMAGPRLPVLPGVGTRGVLVDLEYLTRLSPPGTATAPGQVWLAADAPPSVTAALAKAGVLDISRRSASSELSYLARQGPAVGLAFDIVAGAAGILLAAACIGLMAGVERTARTAELRALRVQGVPAAATRRAATTSHLGLVVLATLAGTAAAAATWWLTGHRLPLFADSSHPDLPSTSTPWWALLAATAGGAAVLGLSAYLAATDLGRRTRAAVDQLR